MGMWGSAGWDPVGYVEQRHPNVRILDTGDLPDGVLGCVNHGEEIIWVACGLTPAERRCTIAYEAAQFEQGPTPDDPILAMARERAAQDWAALMLIPTELFAEAWANRLDLAEMAAFCGVDTATFRNRIRAASDADQDVCLQAIRETRLTA